jgi:hypothetical protein
MIRNKKWSNYGLEFLSIFIAVVSAFALNNWNDNRRDEEAATKILIEINNGLQKDLDDIKINMGGHEEGLKACNFWRKVLANQEIDADSIRQYYLALTRDFFSAQNNSGYETLKSKGLELIKNDSLRFDIISLYEYDYRSLKTMEESYYEMQFQENYFEEFNRAIAPNFIFDQKGNITGLNLPVKISPAEQKILLSYLWKITVNRRFILYYYGNMEKKIESIRKRIEREIGD